jgi:hypothetical protein
LVKICENFDKSKHKNSILSFLNLIYEFYAIIFNYEK